MICFLGLKSSWSNIQVIILLILDETIPLDDFVQFRM